MTSVYFVRHADPDHSVRDDRTRPLTDDGLRDGKKREYPRFKLKICTPGFNQHFQRF